MGVANRLGINAGAPLFVHIFRQPYPPIRRLKHCRLLPGVGNILGHGNAVGSLFPAQFH